MAEITVRRRDELIGKVIEILKHHREGLPAKEVLKQLANSLTLTHSNRVRVIRRLFGTGPCFPAENIIGGGDPD